ncbi:hypothetical protein ACS0TY_007499 [Phlomoides rotata]
MDASPLEHVGNIIGCVIGSAPFSYLGLNVGINHRTHSAWNNLVNRVEKKLTKWSGKLISFAGRVTLIQAVLTAIPKYCLSFYLIPKATIKQLTYIFRRFL